MKKKKEEHLTFFCQYANRHKSCSGKITRHKGKPLKCTCICHDTMLKGPMTCL